MYDRGNAGFPDMPGLADWMRGISVRPGLWIRPLMVMQDAPASWRFRENHPLAETPGVFLDPSVPEVLHRVQADITRLFGWGYTLIKQDFTTWDITGRWDFEMPTSITRAGWAFALQRTGDDTSGRYWERTRKMGINSLAFRMPQHGTFFAADADCVGLRPEIAWEESRQWLDVLAKSSTALFVSTAPNAVGPEQKAALRDAFIRAAPAPPSEPTDWLHTTCPRVWRSGDGEEATYDWHPFPGSAFPLPGLARLFHKARRQKVGPVRVPAPTDGTDLAPIADDHRRRITETREATEKDCLAAAPQDSIPISPRIGSALSDAGTPDGISPVVDAADSDIFLHRPSSKITLPADGKRDCPLIAQCRAVLGIFAAAVAYVYHPVKYPQTSSRSRLPDGCLPRPCGDCAAWDSKPDHYRRSDTHRHLHCP